MLNSEQLELQKKLFNFIDCQNNGTFGVLGSGGTGKTFTICQSINVEKAIFLGATNKVCANLRENLNQADFKGFKVKTIDSFFNFKMEKDENNKTVIKNSFPPESTIPEIVVIDEVSLINKRTYELISELKEIRKVILIGDNMQIPPIEDREDVSRDENGFQVSKIFLDLDFKFTLTTQMRQKEGSKLYSFISGFRDNMDCNFSIEKAVEKYANGDDILFLDLKSKELDEIIKNESPVSVCYKNLTVLGFNYKTGRILTGDPKYKVNEINIGDKVVFDSFYRKDNTVFYTSDIVEVVDKEENINNKINIGHGEDVEYMYNTLRVKNQIGQLKDIYTSVGYKETIRPYYYRKNKIVNKLKSEITTNNKIDKNKEIAKVHTGYFSFQTGFAKLKKPFAITSHKAQGSTFETVIIPIYDFASKYFKDRNQLFYVAISRASHKLVFVKTNTKFGNYSKRVNFSEQERCGIASHQDWKCADCQDEIFDRTYDIDHIVPLGKRNQYGFYGTNSLTNLQALCKKCHQFKTSNQ